MNKKNFIFYKNICITNKKKTQLHKLLYKDNKKLKNDNNFIFRNINQNVSELQYLEQIYDCIEHRENLLRKFNIKN